MLEAPRIFIGLTLPISSAGPSLNYVKLNDTTIDFAALKNYWRQHRPSISTWLQALPKGNLRVLLPYGQFYLKDKPNEPVPFKIDFSLRKNHITARGFWEYKDKFNYELYGDMVGDGFNLSKLNVEGVHSSVNLWGRWQENTIDWKGFIFYKRFYILDINGHLDIQDANIVLKGLSFSVNGDAVALSGYCSKEKLFQCDANMSVLRSQTTSECRSALKKYELAPVRPKYAIWCRL